MSDQYAPELGQMVFGNAWGSHDAGEIGDACVQHVLAEIERVYWNVNQKEWRREGDPRISGIHFAPYYWGDCACGYEEAEAQWSDDNPHAATCYQVEYGKIPPAFGRGAWSKDEAAVRALCKRRGISWDGGRGSAVHCDCGHDEKWRAWRSEHDHKPDCGVVVPNLLLESRPDVEVRWYKHAGRGLTVSRPMSGNEWRDWLEEAIRTVRAADVELGGRSVSGERGEG